MTTMAGPRKTISVNDYPEHLNPFREEDNHNKIRFWTIGRRMSRSNSITFSGIKDLKNSWSLRSFMRKGKKNEHKSSQNNKSTNHVNGDESPVVFRRAINYSSTASGTRSTVGSPERADRYVYGGSVTPLPRSRFQERLRSSQQDVNSPSATPRLARSDITGSRLSVASTNPFDEPPVPPVRASRRKKSKAPPPPTPSTANEQGTNENIELRITESDDMQKSNVTSISEGSKTKVNLEDDVDEVNLKVELKIVEDDIKVEEKHEQDKDSQENTQITNNAQDEHIEINIKEEQAHTEAASVIKRNKDDVDVSFPKIDIVKYRRNSSVNEDDIRLRRGNLEDFHSLSNKRSKSLTNTYDGSYVAYDINLNQSKNFDINSNEEPQKVICKLYDEDMRKKSIDNSISSTEKDFLDIDRATRELEREINKLNSALIEDELSFNSGRLSVSEIRQKFDKTDTNSPNPIPKPRRSHYGETSTPVNGNIPT